MSSVLTNLHAFGNHVQNAEHVRLLHFCRRQTQKTLRLDKVIERCTKDEYSLFGSRLRWFNDYFYCTDAVSVKIRKKGPEEHLFDSESRRRWRKEQAPTVTIDIPMKCCLLKIRKSVWSRTDEMTSIQQRQLIKRLSFRHRARCGRD